MDNPTKQNSFEFTANWLFEQSNPTEQVVIKIGDLRFAHFVYLVLITALFLGPPVLWGISRDSFKTWEIVLVVLLLIFYGLLVYFSFRVIRVTLSQKKWHMQALSDADMSLKKITRFSSNNIHTLESSQTLRNELYGNNYSKSFTNNYVASLNSHRVIIGDFELSLIRRVNGKVGRLSRQRRSYILIENTKSAEENLMDNSLEVLNFMRTHVDLDLPELSELELSGKAHGGAIILFLDKVITHPQRKIELLQYLIRQLSSSSMGNGNAS